MQTDNIYILVLLGMTGIAAIILGFIIVQVKSQQKIQLQTKKMHEAAIAYQKGLLSAVINSQEAERKRIGMDLHDEVGAALSALRLLIEQNTTGAASTQSIAFFNQTSRSEIDKIITSVRDISHDLSPMMKGNFGFLDSILDLSDSINRTGQLHMQVNYDELRESFSIHSSKALVIYRIVKELVNNTIKHAGAGTITLTMDIKDDCLYLSYQDDGKGITGEAGKISAGMGMKNIESRIDLLGGSRLQDNNSNGYSTHVTIPLKQQDELN